MLDKLSNPRERQSRPRTHNKQWGQYQCCGSGMLIPDPGSWFLPIPDPGSRIQKQQQKRGVKKNLLQNFLCSHKFYKIANYFSFEVLKKKIWANFQRIIELFTQKIVLSSQKYGFGIRDPEKNLFRIPDPGVKKAPDPGSRIRIRNTGQYLKILSKIPDLRYLYITSQ